MARDARSASRGFSLTELLVVLAIIMLLVALVLIGTQKVRRMANMAGDTNNQRQIALSLASYSMDFNGALPSPRTSAGSDLPTTWTITNVPQPASCGGPIDIVINNNLKQNTKYHSWTASYAENMIGNKEQEYGVNNFTNPNAGALSEGKLFPYIGDPKVYKSPLEVGGNRVRSYSLNSFVGVTIHEDDMYTGSWAREWIGWLCTEGVPLVATNTTKISRIPQPARTIASITEDDDLNGPLEDDDFNNNGWTIDPRDPSAPGWDGWIDWPAMWDPTAIPFSYMDGSTEVYSLVRQSLPDDVDANNHPYRQPADANGIRNDWLFFRDRLLPGIVPRLADRSFGY